MDALLIILFGVLHIADGVVTYLGLSFANLVEANPILNCCAAWIGLEYAIPLLKLGGLAFIVVLFIDRHKLKSPWLTVTLGSSVGFYIWVVANNVLLVIA